MLSVSTSWSKRQQPSCTPYISNNQVVPAQEEKSDMVCPICGEEVVLKYRGTLDGWCLMKEAYACVHRHYSYYYETGYTMIIVGGVEALFYGYDSPASIIEELYYEELVNREKRKYAEETAQ